MKTETFRDLHRAGQPLVLPNAWDFASAAALADAGFVAIGTTSLGVAAASGLPDARGESRAETLALASRIARLPCLLTVDIEAGFGDPGQLASELAAAGVVGVNIEDGRPGGSLAPISEQCELITAIKVRAPALFVNARTDTHWLNGATDRTDKILADTMTRAEAYLAAGADGIFVPGIWAPADIRAVVSALDAPLNVLYLPGRHTVNELAELGVRRISCGSLLFRAALGAAVKTAFAVARGAPVPADIPSYAEVESMTADPSR